MAYVDAVPTAPAFGRKPFAVHRGFEDIASDDRLCAADPEHRLRQSIEPLREAALLLNDVGLVLSCNALFAELIGSPRSIVVGQIFASYLVDDEEAAFRSFLAGNRCAGGSARFQLLHMDNSVIAVHIALLTLTPEPGASSMRCAIVTGACDFAKTAQGAQGFDGCVQSGNARGRCACSA